MTPILDADAPVTLAKCRRAGTVSHLPLNELASRADAEAFQMATVRALGGEACGYKIGATSVEVQQLLNCRIPIYAPILREDVLPSGATFRIPAGLLGIECELGFAWVTIFRYLPKYRISPRCDQPLPNALFRLRSWGGALILTCLSTK